MHGGQRRRVDDAREPGPVRGHPAVREHRHHRRPLRAARRPAGAGDRQPVRAAARPSVKLEGARLVGYRTILLAGLRDPRLLARLDEFLAEYRRLLERVRRQPPLDPSRWTVRSAPTATTRCSDALEPQRDRVPHEVGLVVDVVADTQELATALASRAGPTGSRFDLTGHLGGGGNFAYPFSPSVIPTGAVYEWSAWHVMDVDDERDPFTVELVQGGA